MTLWLAAAYLLAVNAFGAVLFVADKRAAEADRRRVPERTLLGLAAAGASPAMIGLSRTIRHKTRKEPFRTLLYAILALQIIAAIGLLAHAVGLM